MAFDREFFIPTLFVFAVTIMTYLWNPYWAVVPALLTVGVALFFRDPQREIKGDAYDIVSPADGLVMGVETVRVEDYFAKEVTKITIFLSVFDVHINRAPIAGVVKETNYFPGKFLAAHREEAGRENERNHILIEGQDFSVLVVQIAGLVARRIVCRVAPGDVLEKGHKLGLIRFGSCTEIYVPTTTTVHVKKGDVVRGGTSIVGRWQND